MSEPLLLFTYPKMYTVINLQQTFRKGTTVLVPVITYKRISIKLDVFVLLRFNILKLNRNLFRTEIVISGKDTVDSIPLNP